MKEDIKVMFVDDDAITRMVMVRQLEAKYSVLFSAANGKEGLEIFKKEKPDVVVTDLGMPVMSGEEMIGEIRKIEPMQNVIVISGYHNPIDDDKVLVVQKPVSMERLCNEIDRMIAGE